MVTVSPPPPAPLVLFAVLVLFELPQAAPEASTRTTAARRAARSLDAEVGRTASPFGVDREAAGAGPGLALPSRSGPYFTILLAAAGEAACPSTTSRSAPCRGSRPV